MLPLWWVHATIHLLQCVECETLRVNPNVNCWLQVGATSLSLFTFLHQRRKWQPTPVFLPGESQGRGAWWAAVYGVAQSQPQQQQYVGSVHRSGVRFCQRGSLCICGDGSIWELAVLSAQFCSEPKTLKKKQPVKKPRLKKYIGTKILLRLSVFL